MYLRIVYRCYEGCAPSRSVGKPKILQCSMTAAIYSKYWLGWSRKGMIALPLYTTEVGTLYLISRIIINATIALEANGGFALFGGMAGPRLYPTADCQRLRVDRTSCTNYKMLGKNQQGATRGSATKPNSFVEKSKCLYKYLSTLCGLSLSRLRKLNPSCHVDFTTRASPLVGDGT